MSRRDERGQAVTLNYTIGLGIAAILVTGLLIAGGDFVDNQRERVAETELRVVGQQVAADVEAADRLANSTEQQGRVEVTRRLPPDVTGSSYSVELVEQPDPYLELRTDSPEVEVRIEFTNQTDVTQSQVSGGNVVVNYTANQRIRIESGDEP